MTAITMSSTSNLIPTSTDSSSPSSSSSSSATATPTPLPGSTSPAGAATYYGAIGLAIIIMLGVSVFSRLMYIRRLRAMHASDQVELRRRGEAAGLPTYRETTTAESLSYLANPLSTLRNVFSTAPTVSSDDARAAVAAMNSNSNGVGAGGVQVSSSRRSGRNYHPGDTSAPPAYIPPPPKYDDEEVDSAPPSPTSSSSASPSSTPTAPLSLGITPTSGDIAAERSRSDIASAPLHVLGSDDDDAALSSSASIPSHSSLPSPSSLPTTTATRSVASGGSGRRRRRSDREAEVGGAGQEIDSGFILVQPSAAMPVVPAYDPLSPPHTTSSVSNARGDVLLPVARDAMGMGEEDNDIGEVGRVWR